MSDPKARVTTDPANRPRNTPSSRAIIPSGRSPNLVTHRILVSALEEDRLSNRTVYVTGPEEIVLSEAVQRRCRDAVLDLGSGLRVARLTFDATVRLMRSRGGRKLP